MATDLDKGQSHRYLLTWLRDIGHVAGILPAGFAPGPSFVNTLSRASPVAWAGKNTSMMTLTLLLWMAHVTSRGPALNRRTITGVPLPEMTRQHITQAFYFLLRIVIMR